MKNKIRISSSGLIIALVLTAVFLILPKTSNVIVGYVASLIGVVGLWFVVMLMTKKNAHYPLDLVFVISMYKYLILQLVCSVIVIVLELLNVYTLDYKIFIVVHIILLAIAVIRTMALGAGKEHIDQLEKKVRKQTFAWGMLVTDTEQIKQKIDHLSPEIQKEIETTCDEIRYSDPMSHKSLKEYDNDIKESIITLDKAVESWNDDKISKLCTTIKRQIKDRNNQLKLLK